MELSHSLLEVIRCPVSGDRLVYDKVRNKLISNKAGLEYPIVDGIPILLEAEATKISRK